jgi:hypothetical protein
MFPSRTESQSIGLHGQQETSVLKGQFPDYGKIRAVKEKWRWGKAEEMLMFMLSQQ